MISLKKLTNLTLFVSLLGISASFAMSDDEFDPDENKSPIHYSLKERAESQVSLIDDAERLEPELQRTPFNSSLTHNSITFPDCVETMPILIYTPWPPKLPFENPDFDLKPFNIAGSGGAGGDGDDEKEKFLSLFQPFKVTDAQETNASKPLKIKSFPGDFSVLSGHVFLDILSHLPTQDYAQLGLVLCHNLILG